MKKIYLSALLLTLGTNLSSQIEKSTQTDSPSQEGMALPANAKSSFVNNQDYLSKNSLKSTTDKSFILMGTPIGYSSFIAAGYREFTSVSIK